MLPCLLIFSVLKIYHTHFTLFAYHIISIAGTIASFYILLKELLSKFFPGHKANKFILLNYAVLLCASFFFLSFSISETWFWFSTSTTYLWGISACALGIACLVSSSYSIPTIAVLTTSFLFTGSSSEAYAITALVLLLFVSGRQLMKEGFSTLSTDKNLKKIILAFFLCLISFVINYSAPGRAYRQSCLPPVSVPHSIPTLGISLLKIMLLMIPVKLPFALFFCAPFVLLGRQFSSRQSSFSESRKVFFRALAVFLLITILSLYPIVLAMSEMGPPRSLTHISFFLTCLFSFFFFYAGYRIRIPRKYIQAAFYIPAAGCILIISDTFITQYPVVSKYSEAADKRVQFLEELQHKGNRDLIELDSLPPSGLLYSAEISHDTAFYATNDLGKGLFLDFKIRVKGEE